MENLKGFTYHTAVKCDEIIIFDKKKKKKKKKKKHWDLKRDLGVCRSRPIFV